MNNRTTIGSIVRANFNSSIVFAELGIDFCCGGKITLQAACDENQLNVSEVIKRLKQVSNADTNRDYNQMSARSLIHQIMQIHHKYIATTAPAIQLYLKKLVSRHADAHPELRQVDQLFEQATKDLLEHMEQEEMILFPYVEAMEEALDNNFELALPHFGHVNHPISSMESEHQIEGERFKKIAELTNDYQIPSDGCETYQVTYGLLREFEKDLHTHIHLENNILFPKARDLAAKISTLKTNP